MDDPTGRAALRSLPAVTTLLAAPEIEPLIARHGRALVTDAVRVAIDGARQRILSGRDATVSARDVETALSSLGRRSLVRVVNGTGCVLHTNLGRAPLADAAIEAIAAIAGGYSNLELDVGNGRRGDRHAHVSELLVQLLATEDALAFNNCAGAVLVMLAGLCAGREVIVARSQLIEIGGGFRIPDVMKASGATLVEVGTTNKVYEHDYRAALSDRTAAILSVHRSNFAIVGFTTEPTTSALAAVAERANVPLLVDVGSGLLATDAALGEAAATIGVEPRPKDVLAEGADLVAFSGDKLLGGPQAGLLAGRAAAIARVKKHPLARALRADKLTLAGLEATLALYRDDRANEIPTIRDLSAPLVDIAARADGIAAQIRERIDVAVDVVDGESVPGGGTLPLARLPSRLVLVGPAGEAGRNIAAALRLGETPVITRVVEDRTAIDARTVSNHDVTALGSLVENACRRSGVVQEDPR